jgi:hypothetical protein
MILQQFPITPTRAYLYLKSNGRSPLEEYLRTINSKRELAYIKAAIDRLITNNGVLPMPYAKKVDDKIWELRSNLGNRVFYFIATGREIILLDGYTKKRDRIEPRVIWRVRNMYQEYQMTIKRKPYLPSKLFTNF